MRKKKLQPASSKTDTDTFQCQQEFKNSGTKKKQETTSHPASISLKLEDITS